MSTLIKIIVTSILSFLLFSCNFELGVQGNGKVISENRTIDQSFDQIKASRGLDVFLTQNDTESLTVQADENLHDLIITKVENNILKISTKGNIGHSEAKKVMVGFKNISKISASSGSNVYSTNTILTDNLNLEATSGADMDLEITVNNLYCEASSGSDLNIKGTAENLVVKASSGSDINAGNLSTLTTNATSSSGSDIVVNVSNELIAKAESGSDITYLGNPEKVSKSSGVLGSIKQE